jgi:uncharacterized membrane protein
VTVFEIAEGPAHRSALAWRLPAATHIRCVPVTPEASSPPSVHSELACAALLGASTGLRSQMGMAVLVNGTPPGQLPAFLRHRSARLIALAAALVELVADKLPSTPARTEARGLVPRIGLGALSAGLLARNTGTSTTASAAVGAGAAVGAAFAGMSAREALAKRLPPLAAALLEDLVTIVLAVVALRTVSRGT